MYFFGPSDLNCTVPDVRMRDCVIYFDSCESKFAFHDEYFKPIDLVSI